MLIFFQFIYLSIKIGAMKLFLYIGDARKTIFANKMRSALSTLWIVIGMASVIIMMSLGEGYKAVMMEQMGDIMKNQISIYPGWWYASWDEENDRPWSYIKKIDFTPELIQYIEWYFPSLSGKLSYAVSVDGQVRSSTTKEERSRVQAISENWLQLNEKNVVQGSSFLSKHYQNKDFVTLINQWTAKKFFKKKSPIGQKLKIGKRDYTVIGIIDDIPDGVPEKYMPSNVYIPSTTYFDRVIFTDKLNEITVHLDVDESNEFWRDRITYLLLKKFNQPNKDSAWFYVGSNAEFTKQINKVTQWISVFLLAIGLISLIVGGIGVMNIMIVSVTERTREIWIRKAIGALNKDIVSQFLIESIMITMIWWVLALGLSYGAVYFINKAFSSGMMEGMKAVINFSVVGIAFVITALTGIIFGILPARKAAKLKPIDALRFE